MIIFRYDKTFEGLLTAVFDAYSRKTFPSKLFDEIEIEPLFVNEIHIVHTNKQYATRVWNGLQKKLSKRAFNMLIYTWFSEINNSDELIFRYICKVFNNKTSIETNFADEDVSDVHQIAIKVAKEKSFLHQFARFQKTADNIYFAPLAPKYNALPLSINYFVDRFADQRWIIYDMKRRFGYYYDLKKVSEITIDENNFADGKLNSEIMAEDEKLFQELWKNYFKSITIKERINIKLHRQHMPERFWKYLPEKQ